MSIDPNALSKLIRNSGVAFRENATSYVFECPRCHKKDKLSMYKETGRFICYHCAVDGFQGRPEFALCELLNRHIGEIRKIIYGSDIPDTLGYLDVQFVDIWGENEDIFEPELNVNIPEVCWPPDFVGIEDPLAFVKGARYLYNRGITPEHVSVYDLKYSPADQRVIFPVKVENKLIGWQARSINPTERWDQENNRMVRIPKILTSGGLVGKGQKWLMFQDRLKGVDHCVLAEGPISAIKAHRCGGNVASMGKNVSLHQLNIIKNSVKKLYIALDPDAGNEIAKLTYDLYDDLEIYLMRMPQNFESLDSEENEKDMGDLSENEVYEIFKECRPEPRGKIYISVGGLLNI